MSTEDDGKALCAKCIGGRDFSRWIKKNGSIGKCGFDASHGNRRKVVKIEEFVKEVDRYFRANYQIGEGYADISPDSDKPELGRYGEPYSFIMEELLQCEPDVLEAVIAALPDCSWHDISQGDEPFYDDTATYESIITAQNRNESFWEEYWFKSKFQFQWEDFCDTVKFTKRFFNIKELLDDLFGKPEEYSRGSIRPIYDLQADVKIFRSRAFGNSFNNDDLQKNPTKELGAPPKEKTLPGRMNVEFIPVFYGAFEEETAIAEIRPSIGEVIVIGEFFLKQPLKVFDFTVFDSVPQENQSECYKHTRYEFISQMQQEISKPILPHEKQREYIPTQIVTEYLKEHFHCDAIIYASSVHSGKRNIAVLNRNKELVSDEDKATLGVLSLTSYKQKNN